MITEIIIALVVYDIVKFILSVLVKVLFKKEVTEYKRKEFKTWEQRIKEMQEKHTTIQ